LRIFRETLRGVFRAIFEGIQENLSGYLDNPLSLLYIVVLNLRLL